MGTVNLLTPNLTFRLLFALLFILSEKILNER